MGGIDISEAAVRTIIEQDFNRKVGNPMAMGSGVNGGNLKSAVIALLVPLPSILFYICFLSNCGTGSGSFLWKWCYDHPLLLVNALFFLNVNLVFWLISHVQSSHWVSLLCQNSSQFLSTYGTVDFVLCFNWWCR